MAVEKTETALGTAILIGDDELKRGYERLRNRDELVVVKTIWLAGYEAEVAYFDQEKRDLERRPTVRIERIVSAHSRQVRHLQKLASKHPGRYELFSPISPEISFEVYVCEYRTRPSSSSGILTVVRPDGRQPEFGFLVDGYVDGGLTQFARALEEWFESIKGPPLGQPDPRQSVWDASADLYDRYVGRSSEVAFLREFIRAEDEFLARLIERDDAEHGIVFLEFGSGTGRTIEYLAALPKVTERILYFIGCDNSLRMIERAREKRDRQAPTPQDEKTYYFTLDATSAGRNFGNGRVHLTVDLGDHEHLDANPLEPERYQKARKVISCLLNTVGVLRGDERERIVTGMFASAQAGDTIVISVFSGEMFDELAFELYSEISPIVGTAVVPGAFHASTRTFSAGNYYSQWSVEQEVRELVTRAGGVVVDVRDLENDSGRELGQVFVCEREPSRRGAQSVELESKS